MARRYPNNRHMLAKKKKKAGKNLDFLSIHELGLDILKGLCAARSHECLCTPPIPPCVCVWNVSQAPPAAEARSRSSGFGGPPIARASARRVGQGQGSYPSISRELVGEKPDAFCGNKLEPVRGDNP